MLTIFPKLNGGGGFELLRCKPRSRDLVLIGHRIINCQKLLKRQVVNSKVYVVRPIQRDLNLDVVSSEEDTGKAISFCQIMMVFVHCIILIL